MLLPAISSETEFWQAPKDGVDKAAGEIRQYGVNITYFYFDQNDETTFEKQVKKILRARPQGVLLTPTFPEPALQLIAHCNKTGTPYVMINTDIPGYDAMCYIGPEIFRSGYLGAQLIHYGIKDDKKVVIAKIAREIDNNYAILRKEEGFRAYFKDHGLSNGLLTLDSLQTEYAVVSRKLAKLIKQEPDIGAIFVTNSRVSLVARFLEAAGRKDIILLGYDFTTDNVQYLKTGNIDFLICEKPQEQGYRGIMTLFQHLVYSNGIEKSYLMPIDIITRENYLFYRN